MTLSHNLEELAGIHNKLAVAHAKLSRGTVWCTRCGRSQSVSAAHSLKHGWPKCCGYTMTIDSPEEREALRARSQEG